MYIFLVPLLYLICASMFTISKWGLGYTQPIFFMAVRMLLAGLVLGTYFIIRASHEHKRTLLSKLAQDWFLFAQIVLFHIYLTYICDLCALKEMTSVESAFLYNLSPFIAALFSYLWFGEKMTLKKWLGLTLGFASLLPGLAQAAWRSSQQTALFPQIVTLIAVISSTYGWIILRILVKDRGHSPVFVNGFGMFVAGLCAFVTSWYFEPWSCCPVSEWIPFIQAVILIIVVANIMFYNLYGFLLKYYTATFLSFAGFTCPLFTALLGWFFLDETISWQLLFSFCVISFGLFLFYQEELQQGYIQA